MRSGRKMGVRVDRPGYDLVQQDIMDRLEQVYRPQNELVQRVEKGRGPHGRFHNMVPDKVGPEGARGDREM